MSEPNAENTEPRIVAAATEDGRVVVVSENGMAVEGPPAAPQSDGDAAADAPARPSVTDMVEQPAKVMRIGHMVGKLLEEVKAAPLDEPSRKRLSQIYLASVEELKEGLDADLAEELERLSAPFAPDVTPSDAELRIAQAQLVGWLEGLFQGIQTALFAQQMAARSQLEQMRRALPQNAEPGGMPRPGQDGMYL